MYGTQRSGANIYRYRQIPYYLDAQIMYCNLT
jgi:hypothetical protein